MRVPEGRRERSYGEVLDMQMHIDQVHPFRDAPFRDVFVVREVEHFRGLPLFASIVCKWAIVPTIVNITYACFYVYAIGVVMSCINSARGHCRHASG